MERYCKINKSQSGFRRGKGVFDNLAILTSRNLSSSSENQLSVMILSDISCAYDNINVDLLISLLIKDLLSDRRWLVAARVFHRVPRSLRCFLDYTPTLFNDIIPEDVVLLQFANDIVIVKRGANLRDITDRLNTVLLKVQVG